MMDSGRLFDVLLDHRAPLVNAGMVTLLRDYQDLWLRTAPLDGIEPDVIIANYANGLAHLERLRGAATAPPSRVVILTHRHREWEVRTAISAGVRGYLPHDCAAAELVDAVRAVGAGAIHIHPSLLRTVAQGSQRLDLTSREHQVLSLIAQGCCNKIIARELGIEIGTVKSHVKGVFGKLGATARTHAVALANQRGLVN
ncbi:DNA-binding response regulator, NarL/FixJ family, contains REC and HTH domains [Duganella sp. CF517]|uniref:LuxR C-terminal-related transcriptional regulator n=1 Tax=Duganella sp. CF517 TaxID=1881038 RepID=UPI0008BD377B|nr:response regulator transcription factor [Duganella sp. CF517]SEN49941.1 DNA-binding response regulator, NarL/FixJ family, contains REC and HTH domains [Duganella sp. CF517]